MTTKAITSTIYQYSETIISGNERKYTSSHQIRIRRSEEKRRTILLHCL